MPKGAQEHKGRQEPKLALRGAKTLPRPIPGLPQHPGKTHHEESLGAALHVIFGTKGGFFLGEGHMMGCRG